MLIRRCLDKDPQRRPAHLSVATFLLSGAGETAAAGAPRAPETDPRPPGRRRLVALAVTTFLAGVAVAGGIAWRFVASRSEPAETPPVRFTMAVDTGGEAWRDLTERPFVISPDGRAVVFRAQAGGLPRLFIRTLDRLEPRQLGDQSGLLRTPFFSPDSQWVGFFDGPVLEKVPVSGGPPVTIAPVNGGAYGASWSDDGSIVFGGRLTGNGPATRLMMVPSSGGEPKFLETVDHGDDTADRFPVVLPQSRGVLFRMHDTDAGRRPRDGSCCWIAPPESGASSRPRPAVSTSSLGASCTRIRRVSCMRCRSTWPP
jgi:hypothetical protein